MLINQHKKNFFSKNVLLAEIRRENLEFSKSVKPNSNLTHLGQVRLGQVKKIFFSKNVRIDVIRRENLEFSKSLKPKSLRLGQVRVRFGFLRWKQLSRSILELEQCSIAQIDRDKSGIQILSTLGQVRLGWARLGLGFQVKVAIQANFRAVCCRSK